MQDPGDRHDGGFCGYGGRLPVLGERVARSVDERHERLEQLGAMLERRGRTRQRIDEANARERGLRVQKDQQRLETGEHAGSPRGDASVVIADEVAETGCYLLNKGDVRYS
jgi:hypothetical protein